MKNQPGTMKNHENRPVTMKNQPGTMKNHENYLGWEGINKNVTNRQNLPIVYRSLGHSQSLCGSAFYKYQYCYL